MTDGVIVNRVPESFGMRRERERLESVDGVIGTQFVAGRPDILENGIEVDVPVVPLVRTEFHVPPHVGEVVVLQPHQRVETSQFKTSEELEAAIELNKALPLIEKFQTAEASRAGQTGKIDPAPEQDPIDVAAAEKANSLSLKDQLAALGYFDQAEFIKFKAQVIACLRHGGFDVKKFFGV
jgi:hypothetical protein